MNENKAKKARDKITTLGYQLKLRNKIFLLEMKKGWCDEEGTEYKRYSKQIHKNLKILIALEKEERR